jgi:branched-chain amino acid aminotransferase
MRIWLNGTLQDDLTGVSPLDHGLTTGDGVFETLKAVAKLILIDLKKGR